MKIFINITCIKTYCNFETVIPHDIEGEQRELEEDKGKQVIALQFSLLQNSPY